MEKRIYYHDTDAGGVVYYGRYLSYLEEARTEFLEQKGLSVLGLKERGFIYAVRECHVVYKSPARYGDNIICTATLTKITAAQMLFEQTILDKKDNRLMVEAQVSLVCLTPDFKPTAIPDDVRDKLLA